MKTRNGFVSNSSSSSFVIVTSKENHERAMKALHPYVQDVVNQVIKYEKFLGQDVVYFGDLSVQGYGPITMGDEFDDTIDGKWDSELDDDDENKGKQKRPDGEYGDLMTGYDAVEKWQEELRKEKDKVFEWGEG